MVGLLVGRPECISEGTLGLPFMIFFLDLGEDDERVTNKLMIRVFWLPGNCD